VLTPPRDRTVLDVIQSLRDKSWLRASPEVELAGELSLSLYSTIKDYAVGRAGELARSSARHAAHYAAHAADLAAMRDVPTALSRLRAARGNLDAVVEGTLASAAPSAEDVERALRV